MSRVDSAAANHRLARAVVPVIVSAALLFHVTALLIYNSPANAIRIALEPLVDGYTLPYFYQNWSFFAPSPIDSDISLLVRGRDANGVRTPWLDASMPYVHALQTNRFSSKEIIVTAITNAMVEAVNDQSFRRLLASGKRFDIYDQQGPRILYRMGAAYLAAQYATKRFAAVQVAMQVAEFPRFTHRLEHRSSVPVHVAVMPEVPWPTDIEPIPW